MAGEMCVSWQFLGRSECIFIPCVLQFCWTL